MPLDPRLRGDDEQKSCEDARQMPLDSSLRHVDEQFLASADNNYG